MAVQIQTSNEYLERLRDPRWQRKRLEILERDNWQCQSCWSIDIPLNVHHKIYFSDKEPWDYPNYILVTLCDDCHRQEHAGYNDACIAMAIEAIRSHLISDQILDIPMFLYRFQPIIYQDIVMSAYVWSADKVEIQKFILAKFYDYIKMERPHMWKFWKSRPIDIEKVIE